MATHQKQNMSVFFSWLRLFSPARPWFSSAHCILRLPGLTEQLLYERAELRNTPPHTCSTQDAHTHARSMPQQAAPREKGPISHFPRLSGLAGPAPETPPPVLPSAKARLSAGAEDAR